MKREMKIELHKIKDGKHLFKNIYDYTVYTIGKKEVFPSEEYKDKINLKRPLTRVWLARIMIDNKLHTYYIIQDEAGFIGLYPKQRFITN